MKKTLLFIVMLICAFGISTAQSLEEVLPEQVGLDAAKLKNADSIILAAINIKQIPGAVLAVVRHGKMAYLKAYGNKQIYPTVVPMDVNTVFDMASCTKPMATAISAMILYERDSLRLQDDVNMYIRFNPTEKQISESSIC